MRLPKPIRVSVIAAVILLSSTVSVLAELPAAILEDMLQRQDTGADVIALGVEIADVLDALDILADDVLSSRLLAAFQESGDSLQAASDVFTAMTDAERLPVVHAEAINYAREIYVENMITLDPQYTEGRLARAPDEEKRIRAARNFNDILRDMIAGNNLSLDSLAQLAQYAQPFVKDYLLHPEFSEEFPQEALTEAIKLIKMREEIAAIRERNRQALIELARRIEERRAGE